MPKMPQTSLLSKPLLAVSATVVALGMLMAFYSVVQGAVQSAESRQQALAVQMGAVQRCKVLRSPSARSSCLQQTDVVALATSWR